MEKLPLKKLLSHQIQEKESEKEKRLFLLFKHKYNV